MSKILFVTWQGGGNLAPELGLAAELRRRGHLVRFLAGEAVRPQVASAGFELVPLVTEDESGRLPAAIPESGRRLVGNVVLSRSAAAAVAGAVTWADAAVVDSMMVSSLKAAAERVPALPLLHTVASFWRWTFGGGPIAQAAGAVGEEPPLAVLDSFPRQLVTSLPELEREPAPATYVHVGPVFDEPPAGPAEEFSEGLVLVSFSTAPQEGQQEALQNTLEALGGLGRPVLVTTGPACDPALLRAPAGVLVRRFVHHSRAMPRASLLVGHGGHSTLMLALAHGVPAVVMPMQEKADQPLLAAAVERLGAGRAIPKTAAAAEIRSAVEEVLGDRSYAEGASRLRGAIERSGGRVRAADEVEALLGVRA